MTDEKKTMTRTDVEKILEPVLIEALAGVPGDVDHQRRALRALVHIGVRRLLALGVSPQVAATQVFEGLAKEVASHQQGKEEGTVPASGPVVLA